MELWKVRLRIQKIWLPRLKRALGVSQSALASPSTRGPFNLDESNNQSWHDRARECATLMSSVKVEGRALKVADVGCGDQKLKGYLEQVIPKIDYHGFDLIPQVATVRKLDVQADDLPEKYDVCTILGVMEYVVDPGVHLRRFSRNCDYLIISHVVADMTILSDDERQARGWVTILSRRKFAGMLRKAGFRIVAERAIVNGYQVLWLCFAHGAGSA